MHCMITPDRWLGASRAFVVIAALLCAAPALADPALICDRAADKIAQETGVPLDVLRAITRTETGRTNAGSLKPWPWTVNMEGQGIWFDTEAQARTYVFRHFKDGARSFDIGCFQINYRWHGHAFGSIEDMFDPVQNARYAARFLRELHTELGDWTRAAGAYHSRTHKFAEKYLRRYAEVKAALSDPTVPPERTNGFPLIVAGQNMRSPGSLLPSGLAAGQSLFGDN